MPEVSFHVLSRWDLADISDFHIRNYGFVQSEKRPQSDFRNSRPEVSGFTCEISFESSS